MPRSGVTMLNIAQEAGLSRATVSLALQGSGLIRAETRRRVVETAQALGYIYNRSAASLRKARDDVVGIVINDLTNPFFAELAVGCERVLQSAGFISFIANTAENPVRQAEVIRRMQEHGVAGIIVCATRGTAEDAFDDLIGQGIPVVQAMRRIAGSRASLVIPDNRAGAASAVAHLVSLGHRRIAFAGGFGETSVHLDRVAGYRDGLEQAGLPFDPELVFRGPPNRDFGAACVGSLLRGDDPATALLGFNDAVALGACNGLRRFGKEPGREFAVVGFDDVSEAAQAVPALTTVAVDPQGLGERAAQLILRQAGEDHPASQEYIGVARLIIRESCGARAWEGLLS
ncbi:MAG: LacI family DNA-binding transcriptional regulator [Rhizobiales bacterium]|nr:LacI family DNA-binding transcriptional regulator [Hyphomicrobiales bacterium]